MTEEIEFFDPANVSSLVEAGQVLSVEFFDVLGGGGSGGGVITEDKVARVDSSGSDFTGVVGNVALPFLTVTAAVAAIEALSPTYPDKYYVDIGRSFYNEDITTNLQMLGFIGTDAWNAGLNSVTFLAVPSIGRELSLCGVSVNTVTCTLNDGNGLAINLTAAKVSDTINLGSNGYIIVNEIEVKTPVLDIQAAEDIPAYTFITVTGFKADSANIAHYGKVIGIVQLATLTGFIASAVDEGEITNVAWSWSPGAKLFINGVAISATPPSSGFSQMVAVARNATTIIVRIEPPILL